MLNVYCSKKEGKFTNSKAIVTKCYFFFFNLFFVSLVGESIEVMHAGTMVLKLRGLSKKYPRRYFLDQQAANIRWTPSKKGDRAKSKYAFTCHLREVEEIIMTLT